MLTSIKKAIDIIDAFAFTQREWSILELSRHTGMPQPTVHHFLASLREAGWVVQDPATRRYRLGTRVWEIGCAAVGFQELTETVRPHIRRLVSECGETVHLGMVPFENPLSVIYLDRVDSSAPVRIVTTVGSHAPSHCSAMGKAIVAHNAEFEKVVLNSALEKTTPDTIVDRQELRDDFARTRARGYSMSIGEFSSDMVGLACAVYDRAGTATLGVGVWAPSHVMTDSRIAQIAPQLVNTAKAISGALGHF